jgi:hypothetical protein
VVAKYGTKTLLSKEKKNTCLKKISIELNKSCDYLILLSFHLQVSKQSFWTFLVKIEDIFDQKNASLYLGVRHKNFTILDDKKGPTVI